MISVITKRADFLRANSGLRNARAGFVLLTRPNDGKGIRFGITVTKKIGNAVVRNRMKRRFRELLRAALPTQGLPDHDHVLIGRQGGIERDFALLRQELEAALSRVADGKGDPPRRPGPGGCPLQWAGPGPSATRCQCRTPPSTSPRPRTWRSAIPPSTSA